MTTINDYFVQSELALAAYAILSPSTPDILALQDEGKIMAPTQAAQFASEWQVIDQYTDLVSGFSATVFELS